MYPSVRAYAKQFNEPLEGRVRFMYLDVKGLVTTGIGNLIDPVEAALAMPFKHGAKAGPTLAGKPASKDEIRKEWNLIKSHTELAGIGARTIKHGAHGHHAAYEVKGADAYATLELDDSYIDTLFYQQMDSFETTLKRTFTDFDKWPADAQLGVFSMAWAMGPYFPQTWPSFSKACRQQDFATAATQCHISNANPNRNNADQQLFLNASAVAAPDSTYARAQLYYPQPLAPATAASKPAMATGGKTRGSPKKAASGW